MDNMRSLLSISDDFMAVRSIYNDVCEVMTAICQYATVIIILNENRQLGFV